MSSFRVFVEESKKHEVTLLFQRFNYFLLATSFLIASFVAMLAILSNRGYSLSFDPSYLVAHIIAITGFIISYVFSIINLLNARLIFGIDEYLRKLHSLPDGNPYLHFSHVMDENVKNNTKTFRKYILGVYILAITFFSEYDFTSGNDSRDRQNSFKNIAPHTWLIPLFFAFIWLCLYLVVFIIAPWNLLVIGGIFVISILNLRVIIWFGCIRDCIRKIFVVNNN